MALTCVLAWIYKKIKYKHNKKYYDAIREKITAYDDLAKEIDKVSKVIEKDDWRGYRTSYYTFEKLAKELIELRKFKKDAESNKEA